MTKEQVAAALEEIGLLLELQGENTFRVNAYLNGARTILGLHEDLSDLVSAGKLASIRGIGETLRDKIATLVQTGGLPYLEQLRASIPEGMMQMTRIPGLGPKKIRMLQQELGIQDITSLRQACDSGVVAKLKGFGSKTQQKILDGIRFIDEVGMRVRFDQAYPLGQRLLEQLSALPGVIRSALCGSLRRRRETAKDIDILLSSDAPQPIMDAFVKLPEVLQVTSHGETKSSIIAALTLGSRRVVLNADLRIVSDTAFAYALVHFTGSREHNKRLRDRAQERNLKLNEYELAGPTGKVICTSEEEVYAALNLVWIPPEMREDTGEIELAEQGPLPTLVEASDIQGVFHNHTTYSDGKNTLAEMAEAAEQLGLQYLGIGDHSQSLTVARGLSPERVRQQHEEIDALNAQRKQLRILKGIECDILPDGSLDYADELLAQFDYVVVSVHTMFDMPIDKMTKRICRALAHPRATMLGHATGRLLLQREGYKVDLDAVLHTAAEHGKMIEINAQPSRLDLDWVHCKRARALGIPLVINPDAHSTGELAYFRFGIDVARRAWLRKEDIFNTLPLTEVLKRLGRSSPHS